MKPSYTYGFIIALATSLMSLGFFFTGFHDDPTKLETAQNISMVLGIVIAIVCMVMAMREQRGLTPADGNWGYGSALGTGVMVGLVAALLASIYSYCYFAFINPNMSEVIYQAQVLKMEAKGLSETQIANAEPMMRKMMGPLIVTIMGFIVLFIFNFIIALITAIFVKNRASMPAETTA